MSKKNKNEKNNKIDIEMSSKSYDGVPETSFDLVNKYGTYEIQPTSDMQNEWPEIAQGCPEDYRKPTVLNKRVKDERLNPKQDKTSK